MTDNNHDNEHDYLLWACVVSLVLFACAIVFNEYSDRKYNSALKPEKVFDSRFK